MSYSQKLAKSISNYQNQNSIGSILRRKRLAPLLKMIEFAFKQYGFVNIIDIGGTETYWNIVSEQFLDKCNVSITIVNLLKSEIVNDHGRFKFIAADACDLSALEDYSFHIAHSNSVVEHVGDWNRMQSFAKEISRIGRKFFVQTPNYWFPIEPHCMTPFFHWLPKPIRIWLVYHFQLGHWKKAESVDDAIQIVESARLLNRAMFQTLFKDANIVTEWLFFLPKSFIAIRN